MPSINNPISSTPISYYLEIDELPNDEESRLRVMISYNDGSNKKDLPNKICIELKNNLNCFNSKTGFQFRFKGEVEGEDDGHSDHDRVDFKIKGCNVATEELVTINIMLLADGHISFPANHLNNVPAKYETKIVNGKDECPDDEK